MDFKKILEYNSPKNLHKRLMELNNIQKVIMLFFAPCLIVVTFGWPIVILTALIDSEVGDGFAEFLMYSTMLTPMLSFALYLFQSKK